MDELLQKRSRRSKVLVVDDDPVILEVVRERLEQAGFEVTVRAEALGTTRWLGTHPADYLLLDVMMPALDGSELTALLRRRAATSKTSVILYSSLPENDLARVAQQSGAAGFISKSADAATFVREFRAIADRAPG